MTKRLGVVAVFLAGCAVGGASSQLVVPMASAQQAAVLTKWEYLCRNDGTTIAAKVGSEGWEMVSFGEQTGSACFKRPKL